jgi:transposase
MEGLAPIYLYAGVADMRKSFDGLMGLIEQAGIADADEVLSGAWFVFKNRRGDRIKILTFDRDGLVIWYKRLERGRFQWPSIAPGQPPEAAVSVQMSELRLILEGIDLNSVRRRRRWSRPTPEAAKASKAVENPRKLDNRAAVATVGPFTDEPTANHQSRRRQPPDRRAVLDGHGPAEPGGMAEASTVRA